MRSNRATFLKALSSVISLTGLAGLICAACISGIYASQLPRVPVPSDQRFVPREIYGISVYETPQEDYRLTLLENGSFSLLALGFAFWLAYMAKSGLREAVGQESETV